MPIKRLEMPQSMRAEMIARCGINCSLCMAYLREKNHCAGCNSAAGQKAHHCETCKIKNCPESSDQDPKLCFDCAHFPCARLRQLDLRYRAKYGLSAIANLERIRDSGMQAFIAQEQAQWTCPQCGGLVCMHRSACVFCGHSRVIQPLPARQKLVK